MVKMRIIQIPNLKNTTSKVYQGESENRKLLRGHLKTLTL